MPAAEERWNALSQRVGIGPSHRLGDESIHLKSKFRKKHDDGARLGAIDIARNGLCRFPLDNVVRRIEGYIIPF